MKIDNSDSQPVLSFSLFFQNNNNFDQSDLFLSKKHNIDWEALFSVSSEVSDDWLWDCSTQSHKVSSKLDQKQKFFITRTFFVNKQLTLFFNFLQNLLLNFAQNLRECLFHLAGSESGEKSTATQLFAYISQLFVYKTRLWT